MQVMVEASEIACAWCGHRAPIPMSTRSGRAWIECPGCGASTPRQTAADPEIALELAWGDWRRARLNRPAMPERKGVSSRSIRREKGDERSDVLEVLSRLLVQSSYRVPTEGKSTRPTLQMTDVAAALGFMRGRLRKEAAIAVVTRAEGAPLARLSAMATPRVRRKLGALRPAPLDLQKPADVWRLRLVVFDAVSDLVWPERRRSFGELARAAKVRKANYLVVHKCATSVLQEALNDAWDALKTRIWGG